MSNNDVCIVSDKNEPSVTAMLDEMEAIAVIIRPDRYIHAVIGNAENIAAGLATIPT